MAARSCIDFESMEKCLKATVAISLVLSSCAPSQGAANIARATGNGVASAIVPTNEASYSGPSMEPVAVVEGVVRDARGAAVEGATVALRRGQIVSVNTATDANGHFRIASTQSGRFSLVAEKKGFAATECGRQAPRELARDVILHLRGVTECSLVMWRAGRIEGRVVDPSGVSLPLVQVTAIDAIEARWAPLRPLIGSTLLEPDVISAMPDAGRSVVTDKSGRFEIDGLHAGDYYLMLQETHVVDGKRHPDLSRFVYYPGTSNPRAAKTIVVTEWGTSRASVQIHREPLVILKGKVRTSRGAPKVPVRVRIARRYEPAVSPLLMEPVRVREVGLDGLFEVAVASGRAYDVAAQVGAGWMRGGAQADVEWGRTIVNVGRRQMSNLAITTSPGVTFAGRVDCGMSDACRDARVFASTVDPVLAGLVPVGSAGIASDGTFLLRNVFGETFVSLGLSSRANAIVEAIYSGERDVSGAPFGGTPRQKIDNLTIVVRDAKKIRGTVHDSLGGLASKGYVVVFSPDSAVWEHPTQRFVRVTRINADGTYAFGAVPPGPLVAVALGHAPAGAFASADFLAAALRKATPVPTLGADVPSVDLTLAPSTLVER